MKVFDFEQRSASWWGIRRGRPTASGFNRIITSKGKASSGQALYIGELVAEAASSLPPVEKFKGQAAQNGIDTEHAARCWYEMDADDFGVDVRQVGFCLSDCGLYGCSPDGLIDPDGGLELKCPELKTHAAYLIKGGLPSQYKAQVHGELLVTGRKWWDFVSYAPGLKPLVVRVVPDEFTEMLKTELAAFLLKLEAAKAELMTPVAF